MAQSESVLWENEPTTFIGDKGRKPCSGLEISINLEDTISITAIDEKIRLARCQIVIPLTSIRKVVKALREIERVVT